MTISSFDVGVPGAAGRSFKEPPVDQWLYKRNGQVFRIIRPLTKSGAPPFGFGPTFIIEPFRIRDNDGEGWAKRRVIDQRELGKSIDLDPGKVKRLVQGRVMASFQPGEPYIPKFTIEPTLSSFDDTIEVSFTTDKDTQALIYFLMTAKSGETISQKVLPEMPKPSIWVGSGMAQRREGFIRYAFYYDFGGYDGSVAVDVLKKDHTYPIQGLISGATYAVRVAVFDKEGRGPVFSKEDAIYTLPTLD